MGTSGFGTLPGPFSEPLAYYVPGLVSSEYRNGGSPNMLAWLAVNLQLFQDQVACLAQMLVAYNLNISAVVPTTATASSGSQTLVVASATGIILGMVATGAGIPSSSVVTGLNGTTIVLSTTTTAALNAEPVTFTLSPAVGAQLDVIGVIVGQSRTVAFQPTGIVGGSVASGGSSYVVNDIVTVVQGGASGGQFKVTSVGGGGAVTGIAEYAQGNGYSVASGLTTSGGTGTGLTINITSTVSPVLDDATYRLLLQCRIAQNHWNGQIDGIQAFFSIVFPGGSIKIQDNQDMTATITISAGLGSIMIDLIENGYVVPRPMAVLYNFVLAATRPFFGFDLNTSLIAGFDTGHFT